MSSIVPKCIDYMKNSMVMFSQDKDLKFAQPKLNMFIYIEKIFNVWSGTEKNWKKCPVC